MSAPITDDVNITTTADSVGLSRATFSSALYLSAYATFAERTRTYTSYAAVLADFPVTTSPEALVAEKYFAQSPHPVQLKIGRSALKPTKVAIVSVVQVSNSYAYGLTVGGKGFAETPLTVTSDGTATNDEIVALLVTALNGVASKNYTAAATGSAGSQVVTITGTAAGDWFYLEVANLNDLAQRQSHADPGVATDLAAINVADSDWYLLLTGYNSKAYVDAAAAWVASNKKFYLVDLSESATVTAAVGGGGNDTADGLLTSNNKRVAVAWSQSSKNMLGAATSGRCLPTDPGGATWKWKQLQLVVGSNLTDTHRVNLRAKRANWVEASAGIAYTREGAAASPGWFIDMTRNDDFIESEMAVEVASMLLANDIVSMTDAGIARVEAKMRAVVLRNAGDENKVYASHPAPTFEVPLAVNISTSDRTNRILSNMKWSAQRANAVHGVRANGVITV